MNKHVGRRGGKGGKRGGVGAVKSRLMPAALGYFGHVEIRTWNGE